MEHRSLSQFTFNSSTKGHRLRSVAFIYFITKFSHIEYIIWIMTLLATVHEIVLSASWAHVLTATVIPVLIGLITKLRARPYVKVPLTLLLTLAGTLLVKNLTDDGSVVLSADTLVTFAELYVMQLAVFFGLIKPLAVREKALAPEAGLG